MKIFSIIIVFTCSFLFQSNAKDYNLKSPDGNVVLTINADQGISWKLSVAKAQIVDKTMIDIEFSDGRTAGKGKVKKSATSENKSVIKPEISYKYAEITDHYNELVLMLDNDINLYFRAYNDGVAYCFEDLLGNDKNVNNELMRLNLPEGSGSWFPFEEKMYSHNERGYNHVLLSEIKDESFCSLPVLFDTRAGTKILFTESALHDYPNTFLKATGDGLLSIFPKYVLKAIPNEKSSPDRSELITEEADYIATGQKARKYPWRIFIATNDDRKIIESTLSYNLAEPCVLENTSWIKPGKVAWDWYNYNNIFGVDFRAGLNTETYKYYIDFAAANKIEYVIFDEGWTKSTTEILDYNPDIDVKKLIDYANSKGVGIILWVLWKPLSENMDVILKTYSAWGAKGVKVDFMQRSDQAMVSSYEEIAAKAAEYNLLVDFHGCFKPSGLQRKYPNVLNFEGVRGGENNKWIDFMTPDHNLTIPFTRMVAGPMDYTPGSMLNANKGGFYANFTRPMSQGTRCHQIAMYVVYEAPLQMMCESPSVYLKEQESVDFITQIPTTWDETRVLEAKVGDYIVVARRKGENWYIGAMTDWADRKIEIPLDFITGTYEMNFIADGINADRNAQDYKCLIKKINQKDKLTIDMKPGGGFAAILRPL
ncbi:MAG: alpha-glucosidase [Bacteroidetes bacterium GWF2_38_335]|nr:MAG: alpha-glucosidase [Bacteroidetes bacterium GWF2_38_335]OFY81788.1 MAG: alpha-glucosidase [Bacteroidetes bacterium RIFOXYA12_FULL_38_20]HBS87858.1 alpha-glucosidase [Bacteroidales bacterium]